MAVSHESSLSSKVPPKTDSKQCDILEHTNNITEALTSFHIETVKSRQKIRHAVTQLLTLLAPATPQEQSTYARLIMEKCIRQNQCLKENWKAYFSKELFEGRKIIFTHNSKIIVDFPKVEAKKSDSIPSKAKDRNKSRKFIVTETGSNSDYSMTVKINPPYPQKEPDKNSDKQTKSNHDQGQWPGRSESRGEREKNTKKIARSSYQQPSDDEVFYYEDYEDYEIDNDESVDDCHIQVTDSPVYSLVKIKPVPFNADPIPSDEDITGQEVKHRQTLAANSCNSGATKIIHPINNIDHAQANKFPPAPGSFSASVQTKQYMNIGIKPKSPSGLRLNLTGNDKTVKPQDRDSGCGSPGSFHHFLLHQSPKDTHESSAKSSATGMRLSGESIYAEIPFRAAKNPEYNRVNKFASLLHRQDSAPAQTKLYMNIGTKPRSSSASGLTDNRNDQAAKLKDDDSAGFSLHSSAHSLPQPSPKDTYELPAKSPVISTAPAAERMYLKKQLSTGSKIRDYKKRTDGLETWHDEELNTSYIRCPFSNKVLILTEPEPVNGLYKIEETNDEMSEIEFQFISRQLGRNQDGIRHETRLFDNKIELIAQNMIIFDGKIFTRQFGCWTHQEELSSLRKRGKSKSNPYSRLTFLCPVTLQKETVFINRGKSTLKLTDKFKNYTEYDKFKNFKDNYLKNRWIMKKRLTEDDKIRFI